MAVLAQQVRVVQRVGKGDGEAMLRSLGTCMNVIQGVIHTDDQDAVIDLMSSGDLELSQLMDLFVAAASEGEPDAAAQTIIDTRPARRAVRAR